jgi:hypothetical protein
MLTGPTRGVLPRGVQPPLTKYAALPFPKVRDRAKTLLQEIEIRRLTLGVVSDVIAMCMHVIVVTDVIMIIVTGWYCC